VTRLDRLLAAAATLRQMANLNLRLAQLTLIQRNRVKVTMTMTKYKSHDRYRSEESEMGTFDKFYYSFSTEFWLIAANLVVVANWFMHPESLGSILLLAVSLGLVVFAVLGTNRRAQQLFRQFKRDHRTNGLLMLVLGLVVGVTVFNFATDPSHALILTTSGQTSLTTLLSGGTGATAATSSGTTTVKTVVDNLFLVFKALFFISFMWALYKSYEKYTDQADLSDVIKTPIVLLLVVGLIDGSAGLFLGA
jgi:4-amino-4-deoxy-L-arabinose transferase-like glycosyltransferase